MSLGLPPVSQRRLANGVPVFCAEAPGPCTAALVFRVGTADERLPLHGISHLVEHLVLFGVGSRPYEVNGLVDALRTTFHASGTQQEAMDFLTRVARAIADPPLTRLESERQVLRTELQGREPGFAERLLALRYGPAGHGLDAYEQHALTWAGAAEISAWMARDLTSGNAALWISRELDGLPSLELPDGPRRPVAEPVPISGLVLPAQLAQGTGGVGVTGVGRRSTALHTALRIARERCLDRLRHGRAETYSVYGDYERLSPSLAHVSLGADCLDHHAGSVRDGLLDVLEELAGSGPSDEELEWDRKRARDGLLDPASVHRTLDGHALRELMGLPVLTPAALWTSTRASARRTCPPR